MDIPASTVSAAVLAREMRSRTLCDSAGTSKSVRGLVSPGPGLSVVTRAMAHKAALGGAGAAISNPANPAGGQGGQLPVGGPEGGSPPSGALGGPQTQT